MSQLTGLEKAALRQLLDIIEKWTDTQYSQSDSIADFVHKQFTIDTDEPQTLEKVRDFVRLVSIDAGAVANQISLVKEHFGLGK